ncbi:MAG: potassium transporter [Hydrocarboniphaga sp.]|nr:potassium transporter TrkG [Hydrocarboniphaga sp.]MDB5968278.1 potassium transporter [Hydrocarboniphaga sp.]
MTVYSDPGRRSNSARRFLAVQRLVGLLLMLFSLTMLPPVAVGLYYGESTQAGFISGMWITLVTGAAIWWPTRRMRGELKIRDGFLVTVLLWTVLGAFGAIPLFLASDVWPTGLDAIFESVSGLTTTGATVVPHGIDQLPRSINYYRAQLHWLGGMGIIVLAVAVLPMLGVGGMQLSMAETPGPMKNSKLTPRITETARVLSTVYMALTAVCGLTYWALGMSLFDAICHAFSTLSSGGFSTHDASIGYFNSAPIEFAAMFFMLIGASNFALHYLAWDRKSLKVYLRDGEFRTFLTLFVVFGVLVCAPLVYFGTYPDVYTAVRRGMFQLIAFGTDAGFTTADPTHWPSYVPLLLVLASFMLGCSGSTAGGVKMIRLILFVKQALRELQRLVHPSAQLLIKFDGKTVSNDIVYAVGGFFSVYVGFTIMLTFAMIGTGLDAVTAFSAVAGCMNNAGPGLGILSTSMAPVSETGKGILIFAMLLGRLEVFTLLVVFTPAFWRR